MKSYLFLLTIFLLYSHALAFGEFKEIDSSDPTEAETINDLLAFATREFAIQASQSNSIPDSHLDLVMVHNAYKQVVNGLNYKFNLEFLDSELNPLFVTLIVYYQPWTEEAELASYTIHDAGHF